MACRDIGYSLEFPYFCHNPKSHSASSL
jgi:hypothetical protein